MHKIIFEDNFLNSAKKLDKRLKPKLNNLLKNLQKDLFHPSLHTKPLRGKLTSFYSFRLGRNYRVIFKFIKPNTIYIINVAHRKDIYK